MGNVIGFVALLVLISMINGWREQAHDAYGNPVVYSAASPTGQAVVRRYYDLETGDSYVVAEPVVTVASLPPRLARGSLNYGYDVPPMGIQPRSY
jgi:hypothetical protein